MSSIELVEISRNDPNAEKVIEYAKALGVTCNTIVLPLNDFSEISLQTNDLNQMISELFAFIGVPACLHGYSYLRTAVLLALIDPTYLRRKVTLALYPAIAIRFDTKASCVERAIRHAVTVVWDRGNQVALMKIFGNSISDKTGKPTNSEFIARIVELIKTKAFDSTSA